MSDKRAEIWATLDAGLTKWMSKAYESGKQDELERIIGLLENQQQQYAELLRLQPNRNDDAVLHAIARTWQAAIALIKGENK